MIPSAAEIVVARWRLVAWLRIIGGVFIFIGLPAMVSWLGEGLRDGDLWSYYYYAERIIIGLGGLILGPIILALAPLLVRLLLPVPASTECPRCRYPMAGASGGRCPECGLEVGDAYIAGATSGAGRRPGRWARLLDESAPSLALLGCAWTAVLALLALVGFGASLGPLGVFIWLIVAAPVLISQAVGLRLAARAGALRRPRFSTKPGEPPPPDPRRPDPN